MMDLDELIFVDEDDWTTLPEDSWEEVFSDEEEDFLLAETEEAETLRYLVMLDQLDEFASAYQPAGDTAGPEPD